MDRPDLTFNYLHPARTTPQQPQNLLRPTNKGISDCGCNGNIAASYGLGGLGMYTLLNNGVARVLTRPLGGLGQGDEVTYDADGRVVVVGYSRWWWLYGVIGLLCGGLSAYHGYKRNNSVGWAIGWYFFGAWLPFLALPIAFAQGFAVRARGGTSGFNGRMTSALGRTKRRRRS